MSVCLWLSVLTEPGLKLIVWFNALITTKSLPRPCILLKRINCVIQFFLRSLPVKCQGVAGWADEANTVCLIARNHWRALKAVHRPGFVYNVFLEWKKRKVEAK